MTQTILDNFSKTLSACMTNECLAERSIVVAEVSTHTHLKPTFSVENKISILQRPSFHNTTEKFDFIVMLDALQRSTNPYQLIIDSIKHLKDDGYCLVRATNSAENSSNITWTGINDTCQANKLYLAAKWSEEKSNDSEEYYILRKIDSDLRWDKTLISEPSNFLFTPASHITDKIEKGSIEVEKTSGAIHYLDFFRTIHHTLSPRNYLEIGIRFGKSFEIATCRKTGVDPSPEYSTTDTNATIFPLASDDFFESHANYELPHHLDFIFIDGMHLFEYALRDFINTERFSHENSLVIFDDIFPSHNTQALRNRSSQVWTGDVWKIIPCLQKYRPDLTLIAVDTSPTGLLLVINPSSNNSSLAHNYNNIIKDYLDTEHQEVPKSILARENIISPSDPGLITLLDALREKRLNTLSSELLERLSLG